MALPTMTRRSATITSMGVLLIGLGAMLYTNWWWPIILLVIGATMGIRQYLRGRFYDMLITSFVFGGLFLFYFISVDWDVLMPVLFVTGGLYLIFREYFLYKKRTGLEQMEDMREEIEDDRRSS